MYCVVIIIIIIITIIIIIIIAIISITNHYYWLERENRCIRNFNYYVKENSSNAARQPSRTAAITSVPFNRRLKVLG